MSHYHSHAQDEGRNLGIAFVINTAFAILELLGGLWTNSLAILSDSLHDLGDSFSLGMAWYFQKLSTRKADARYTYGYRRFSLLGALINGLVLFVGSIFIIYRAIPRLIHPQEAHAEGMIYLAILGVVINGVAAMRLRFNTSLNSRVARLHLMEDVLGWIAVLIGAVVIHYTDWYIIDSILSLGIALYILTNVFRNLRQSIAVILQSVPSGVDMKTIEERILAVEGVCGVHDLHVWSLDGEHNVLTAHVEMDTADQSAQLRIKDRIREGTQGFGIQHYTLELEQLEEHCIPVT